ncbi:MBL fold metallo-hydrolase [Promethearchaeum syntrophicum]|uniref:MBL fold metallo-hydrolase n=1 Tax=Promethearchaeum syntrophicum TaxID=2594042 RepID=A0A5B9DD45_9ARCH|nr:MBL fold metallo-hydrolase [Candidatus Prometheoarchaeum syntrophicum]QEE17158.1 Hydroxyacylglutathione hydrolase [Candidatus Prometheoarchaeum syntrophicum]
MDYSQNIHEVTPHTLMFQSDNSNAGAIILPNSIVAIDPTMYPPDARGFRTEIEKKYNKKVKFLLITHYHGDHVFGAGPFKEVERVAHESQIELIDERLNGEWSKEALEEWKNEEPERAEAIDQIEILKPTVTFESEFIISDEENSDRVEIYHTGGHTKDSSFAYFPKEKVVFTGDLIFAESFPWACDKTCNPDDWILAFEKILSLDFAYVIPGHGPLTGREEMEKHLNLFKELRKIIKESIENGIKAEDIKMPDFYPPIQPEMDIRSIEHWIKFYSDK